MKTARIAAALAMAFLCVAPGIGSTWEHEPFVGPFPPSCTAAGQRCVAKLERLQVYGMHDWTSMESALLKLRETDPECAVMLQGVTLHGF